MKFAYLSSTGDFFVSSDPNCDIEPCSMCGGYFMCLGECETVEELVKIMFENNLLDDYTLEVTGREVQFVKKEERK